METGTSYFQSLARYHVRSELALRFEAHTWLNTHTQTHTHTHTHTQTHTHAHAHSHTLSYLHRVTHLAVITHQTHSQHRDKKSSMLTTHTHTYTYSSLPTTGPFSRPDDAVQTVSVHGSGVHVFASLSVFPPQRQQPMLFLAGNNLG